MLKRTSKFSGPNDLYRLQLDVQLNQNGRHWMTIDDGETLTLAQFISHERVKYGREITINPDGIHPSNPEAHFPIMALPVNSFPMEKYLQYRLKKYEAQASQSETYKLKEKVRNAGFLGTQRFAPKSVRPFVS